MVTTADPNANPLSSFPETYIARVRRNQLTEADHTLETGTVKPTTNPDLERRPAGQAATIQRRPAGRKPENPPGDSSRAPAAAVATGMGGKCGT